MRRAARLTTTTTHTSIWRPLPPPLSNSLPLLPIRDTRSLSFSRGRASPSHSRESRHRRQNSAPSMISGADALPLSLSLSLSFCLPPSFLTVFSLLFSLCSLVSQLSITPPPRPVRRLRRSLFLSLLSLPLSISINLNRSIYLSHHRLCVFVVDKPFVCVSANSTSSVFASNTITVPDGKSMIVE